MDEAKMETPNQTDRCECGHLYARHGKYDHGACKGSGFNGALCGCSGFQRWESGTITFSTVAEQAEPSRASSSGPPPPVPAAPVKSADDASLKYDAGKPGLELLPFESLTEIAKVLDYGARKYAADNWRKGMKWRRLIGAALRHVFAWASGQDRDPETGLSHLAHAGCCILFLLSYELTGAGTDDRHRRTP